VYNVKAVAGQAVAKMMIELLADLSGYQEQVEELRQDWIKLALTTIGVEEDLLENLSQPDLFDYFIQSGIDIVHYPSFGGTEILLENEVIAEWAGPEYKVEFDENNSPYYRISIEYWITETEEEYE